jgi:formylglycine-generating enzyme required for sulfatase activity
MVLAEAMVEWASPVTPERLLPILTDDEPLQSLLAAELERCRVLLTGEPRRRAGRALDLLPLSFGRARAAPPPAKVVAATRRRPFRHIILILLLLTFLGFLFWRQRQSSPADMVAMPAAAYLLAAVNGDLAGQEQIYLDAFWVDRFEVTNRDYRHCVERGACAWPARTASATRNDYFTDPAFDEYPVVNVTQAMAASYCQWHDKRLPTASEWQAAASVAPTTGQPFRFPWGESFEAQRTNGVSTGSGDTVPIGSFRPGGDSPSGAADMAGNVAEWTATLVPGKSEPEVRAVVKGGSFASTAEALAVAAGMQVVAGNALPQVGFRCARTISR